MANQLADAQGAGSDARMHVQQGANPSSHNTPAGLSLIVGQLRGNIDYLKAREQLAAAWPDKSDNTGFESTIGAHLDPRAFQYSRLTPQQKTDYFKGIADKDAFITAYNWAKTHQLPLGGANAAQ